MSYVALYRKWRPLTFEDVVEQNHVVSTLKNSIILNRIGHAYLFSGTRGTGKTTVAKIFARAVNCLSPVSGNPCNECTVCRGILNGEILDVIEMDAASNNSVDNIRDIKEEVIYKPTGARFKVYIIDEVHMLSTGAFNALLKTLEEPPEHVIFILATTEPHKLPATILSRCQRFDFRRISVEGIKKRLLAVAKEIGVDVEQEVLTSVAKISDGAMRDAISILDQCIASGKSKISLEDLYDILGLVETESILKLINALVKRDIAASLALLDEVIMQGRDIQQYCVQLIEYFRDLLLIKLSDEAFEILLLPKSDFENLKEKAELLSKDEIIYIINELSGIENRLKWATKPRVIMEVCFVKICMRSFETGKEELYKKVKFLETRILELEKAFLQHDFKANKAETKLEKDKAKTENKILFEKNSPAKPSKVKEVVKKGIKDKKVDKWSDILKELKEIGRMKIYMQLIDTQAVWADDNTMNIVFKKEDIFKKSIIEKRENLEVLRDIAQRVLGKDFEIRCLDIAEKTKAVESSDRNLKDFLDTARRSGISVKVLDE